MNWYDYARGYDDGIDDYRTSRNNNNLLVPMLRFAFALVILLMQLSWCILKGLAGLLWAIIKLVTSRIQ